MKSKCEQYESFPSKYYHGYYKSSHIQLFRESLSYKRGKAYAALAKVIMVNDGFMVD